MTIPPPRSRSGAGLHEAGILLVQGIGGGKGDALVACGDTLADWLRGWFAGRGQGDVQVEDARLTGAEPAHAVLRLSAVGQGGAPVRWLLAECHWPAAVRAPDFRAQLAWACRVAPATLLYHASDRLRRGRGVIALLRAALGAALVLLLFPVLAALLVLSLLMVLMPVPLLRRGGQAIHNAASALLGGAQMLTAGALQRAAILGALRGDLVWMRQRCRRVCIVAHAQGAAIAHALLQEQGDGLRDVRILALGSGEDKLAFLERLGSRRGAAGLAWLLLPLQLAASAALYGLLRLTVGGAAGPVVDGGLIGVGALLWCCALALAAAVCCGGLLLAAAAVLLPVPRGSCAGSAGGRPGDVDFVAACDPVPSGAARRRQVAVRNLDSVLRDGSCYFSNRDEFISLLVSEIAAAAGTELPDGAQLQASAPSMQRLRACRGRRLRALRTARTLTAAVAALVVGAHWLQLFRAPQADPAAVELLLGALGGATQIDWRALAAAHPMALTLVHSLLVLAALGACYGLLCRLWRVWEQDDLDAWYAGRAGAADSAAKAAFLAALPLSAGLLVLYELSLLSLPGAAVLLGALALAVGLWRAASGGAAAS